MQLNDFPFSESGYLAASNAGNGFVSSGFDSILDFFLILLNKINVAGALMLNDSGYFPLLNDEGKVLNLASGVLTELSVPHCGESRCEQ